MELLPVLQKVLEEVQKRINQTFTSLRAAHPLKPKTIFFMETKLGILTRSIRTNFFKNITNWYSNLINLLNLYLDLNLNLSLNLSLNLNNKAKVKVKGLSASTLVSTSTLDEFIWVLKDINFELNQGEVQSIGYTGFQKKWLNLLKNN